MRDIWPSREDIQKITNAVIKPEMFKEIYAKISLGTDRWNSLEAPVG